MVALAPFSSKRNLAARALCQHLDSDLDTPFAQRRCRRAKLERYEPLKLVLPDRYDQQLSNAVLKSSFYCISGVESGERLKFQHVKIFKTL